MVLNQGIRLIIVGRTITPIKEDNLEMQSSFYSWRNIQPAAKTRIQLYKLNMIRKEEIFTPKLKCKLLKLQRFSLKV